MFDDDMIDAGGKDSRRGWNRAVIQHRSSKLRQPNVTIADLTLPNGLGNFRMFRTCAMMAGIMTVLYVWVPLMVLNVFVHLSGPVYAAALGGSLLLLTAFLYVGGTRETQRERELATRL
jgi:hypothetical protein